MISHNFPNRDTALSSLGLPGNAGHSSRASASDCVRSVRSAECGPLCVELHIAARLQRARFDPWFVSLSSRPWRLRGSLLLPGAGSPGDRRRGERADGGDRGFDRALRTILRPARTVRSRAVWDQRDAENRRRGACGAEREPEASCGHYRDGGVRRSRSQVSDLGTRPFPKRARGGHTKGARAQGRTGFPIGGARCARSAEMMAGGGGSAVAGGPALHIPVLGRSAVELLQPRQGGVYIDGTFGAGGYTRAILAAADCSVIGIDRDQTAIALGADLVDQAGGRLTLIEDRFSNLETIARDARHEAVDGVVFDLGVSSMQLDSAERGFSFRLDGPLDMRMSAEGPSAADVVNAASERDLASIIYTLGDERHSREIARAIVNARTDEAITTTHDLAHIVGAILRHRAGDIHPATRTFQALRIFVNGELGELLAALQAAARILKPGGRLVVVSFHSLEDRIVKNFLADRGETRAGSRHAPEVRHHAAIFQVLTKRPLTADEDEVARNPRARSAKLRAAARTEAAARRSLPPRLLPHLPTLSSVLKGR